ncbi:MAG: M36 family metallopeptidase [Candidatus Binatia bacterium]
MRTSESSVRATFARSALVVAVAAALACANLAAAAVSPSPLGPDHRVQLLTAPSGADPVDIAAGYLAGNAAALGLTAADVVSLLVEHQYRSDTLGTNVFYQQKVSGIPVFNAITSVHVLESGAILAVNNRAISDLGSKLSTTVPLLSAASAYSRALGYVGKSGGVAVPLMSLDALRQGVAFTGVGATRRPVPVQLIYVQRPDGLVRLAWEVYAMTSADEVWYLHVDAVDGSLLGKQNLVNNLSRFRVYPFNSESPISTESPTNLGHQVASEFGDLEASPIGWLTGASTTGNNVTAVEDRDNDGLDGFQPAGTPEAGGFLFDYAHDDLRNPCEQPAPGAPIASDPANLKPCDPYDPLDHNTNLEAAIVNLFYWNNVIHDVMWHYGFTEGAGNFQQTNFTLEGTFRDFDPVFAQAQDGSGTNNANFFTPPDDGVTPILLPPEMQMYEWSPPGALRVNTPADFDDFDDGDNTLAAATASFGTSLADLDEAERTGDLELGGDDSTGDGTGTPNDGCEPLVGFTPGKIALVERGLCEFGVKVLNAENAGAKAVVIANTLGREVGTPMGPGAVGSRSPSRRSWSATRTATGCATRSRRER